MGRVFQIWDRKFHLYTFKILKLSVILRSQLQIDQHTGATVKMYIANHNQKLFYPGYSLATICLRQRGAAENHNQTILGVYILV